LSDAYPLYPGRQVSAADIKDKLQHLGYIAVRHSPDNHGEYFRAGGHFEIYLHSFEYPQDSFEGYPISFSVSSGVIQDLIQTDTGAPISLTRLEPELVASIFDQEMEDRTVTTLDQVPEDLIQAIIKIEDERYYSHFGVDPIGIARAFVSNIMSGSIVQGGSTLTQQLVKNIFLYPKKSYIRKFNEMIMATMMEMRYSKDEILQAYLNGRQSTLARRMRLACRHDSFSRLLLSIQSTQTHPRPTQFCA
jgi:penicillin-binding protein 1B